MADFTFRIAGLNIHVRSRYDAIVKMCADYIADAVENPDLEVETTEEKLQYEREHAESLNWTDEYLETLSIYREIADKIPQMGRMLMHGASISYGDGAYLFTAASGTGKSTHILLWRKYLGPRVDIVNGDKPLIWNKDGELFVCGTPWAGKECWQRNVVMPLKGLIFVNRGEKNSIERCASDKILQTLLPAVYAPTTIEGTMATYDIIDAFVRNIPSHVLHCNMEEDAVKTSFEAVTGLSYESYKE